MSDLLQAKTLLDAAFRDLKTLPVIIDAELIDDETFGYHVQQSVEKCLKAWLAALGEVYPYTHDLNRLLERLEKLDCDVSNYENFVAYSIFAAQVRYVGLGSDAEPIDREGTIEQVQSLYDRVSYIFQSISDRESKAESE